MELNLAPRGPEPHNNPRFISSLQEGNGGGLACGTAMGSGENISKSASQTREDS